MIPSVFSCVGKHLLRISPVSLKKGFSKNDRPSPQGLGFASPGINLGVSFSHS